MDVFGYIVRFCDDWSCSHTNDQTCSNATTSKYYIDPEDDINITGVPLVVVHNEKFIVGKCSEQVKTDKGIFIKCVIDDAYFKECLERRYVNYKNTYNATISFETFCKKTLSSFSLSHEVNFKKVRHVSLVDTPGRKGTAVNYIMKPGLLLKRRTDNQYISDVIASHSAAYLPVADRTSYLVHNTILSYNPGDVCYINASRKMHFQDQFNEAKEIYKIVKKLQSEQENEGRSTVSSLKRNRKTEDDSYDDADEEGDMKSLPKIKKMTSEISPSAVPLSQPMIVDAMRDGIQEGIQEGIKAVVDIIKQQVSTSPKPIPSVAVEQEVVGKPPQIIEAGRTRTTTITLTPDQAMLDLIVNHIVGDKK